MICFGQLELWEGKEFFETNLNSIENILKTYNYNEYLMSICSIKEGINYFFTKSERVKKILEDKLGAKFDKDIGKTQKIYLRKEIIKLTKSI